MNPRGTITALIALAALTTAARAQTDRPAARATPAKAAPDFYPMKVGTKWHYEIDPGNGRKVRIISQIGGEDRVDGRPLARLDLFSNGRKLQATEHLRRTDEGVFRVRMNEDEVTPPLCLIKYPAKAGQSWESEMSTGRGSAKVRGSMGVPEEVEVPAGKFRAFPCTVTIEMGSASSKNVYWFAEGVGIVKQLTEYGDQSVSMELTRYEPAK